MVISIVGYLPEHRVEGVTFQMHGMGWDGYWSATEPRGNRKIPWAILQFML